MGFFSIVFITLVVSEFFREFYFFWGFIVWGLVRGVFLKGFIECIEEEYEGGCLRVDFVR